MLNNTLTEIRDKTLPVLMKHKVKRAGIFGSTATGAANHSSDIDILIELGEQISLLDFIGLKYELEDLLCKKVDLVEYGAIKPNLRERILAEEIRIYG